MSSFRAEKILLDKEHKPIEKSCFTRLLTSPCKDFFHDIDTAQMEGNNKFGFKKA